MPVYSLLTWICYQLAKAPIRYWQSINTAYILYITRRYYQHVFSNTQIATPPNRQHASMESIYLLQKLLTFPSTLESFNGSAKTAQITGNSTACLTAYSAWEQQKNQISTSVGFCRGNPTVTGRFPSQRASNEESVSMASCPNASFKLTPQIP